MSQAARGSAYEVVVVGAGLAGLTAAIRARQAGMTVAMVHFGTGGLQLSQGSIDLLGYAPDRVSKPLEAIEALASARPDHPYARLGGQAGTTIGEACAWLADALGPDLLTGDPAANLHLPTAVGAVRPTALAAPSVAAGQVADGQRLVVVGLAQLKDFHAALVAANLTATTLPDGGRLSARAVVLDFPVREGVADSSALAYARALDDPAYLDRLAQALRDVAEPGERIALPGVLGLRDRLAWTRLRDAVGQEIFEIPLPPPCVPGMRMNLALVELAKALRVRVITGAHVDGIVTDAGRITAVRVNPDARPYEITCDHVIHAPGGFESGALQVDSYGAVTERAFGLPLTGISREDLIHGDYWGEEQPLFYAGLAVDSAMRVIDGDGAPVHPNLYAAGGVLAGASRWREKSGDGIALASAFRAVDSIIQERS